MCNVYFFISFEFAKKPFKFSVICGDCGFFFIDVLIVVVVALNTMKRW